MVEDLMQIFRPDRSEPIVQISSSLRKTKSKNKHSLRNPKISAHT
jgi:hypothetical protein